MKDHQEIFDFFKRHGCTKEFKIVDLPCFYIWNLNPHTMQITGNRAVVEDYIGTIDDFIKEHMSDNYSNVYIYASQDFRDYMGVIRFHRDIPDILVQRKYKIEKLKNKLNDQQTGNNRILHIE